MSRALAILLTALPAAALADRPPVPRQATVVNCAAGGGACVTIDRRAGTLTVTRGRGGPALWRVRSNPSYATVSRDGRFVFEDTRDGGMLGLDDGLDTVVLSVRDRGRVTRELRVRDLAARVADLPQSASHRRWSVVRYFTPANRFVAELYDHRLLSIDPATGAVAIQAAPGDGRRSWCRFDGTRPLDPCARG